MRVEQSSEQILPSKGRKLTEAQQKILTRAASGYGVVAQTKSDTNIVERLRLRGLVRISCYSDKYFATGEGRAALGDGK